jgi:predicted phosphodiesterase
MRVFAMSDIHTDFKQNLTIIENLSLSDFKGDILILAGDVADKLDTIHHSLSILRERFDRIFYVPGNHELWVRGSGMDSLEKFNRVLELSHQLDIETAPAKLNGLWIVPLLSWYESSFDIDPQDNDLSGWADFRHCKWPQNIEKVSQHFMEMNRSVIHSYDAPVISFSHFLPRSELLPPKRHLRFKGLPKVSGSVSIEAQVREIGSRVHVFGHSHINYDCVIDGIRYVQNALSYPKEQRLHRSPVKMVWDSEIEIDRLNPMLGMAGSV